MLTLFVTTVVILFSLYKFFSLVKHRNTFVNWDRTIKQKPSFYHAPKSVDQIISIARRAYERKEKIKAIGAMHSWSDVAKVGLTQKSPNSSQITHLISLDQLNSVLSLDLDEKLMTTAKPGEVVGSVTVEAGIRIKDLISFLETKGLTLRQLGSIMEQSIAGMMSTGTHGSSKHCGILATNVVSMELITGKGDVLHLSSKDGGVFIPRSPSTAEIAEKAAAEPSLSILPAEEYSPQDIFQAAAVGIGALGIITKVELKVVKAFHLHLQEEPFTIKEMLEKGDELLQKHDYAKIWYFPFTDYCQFFQQTFLPHNTEDWPTAAKQAFKNQSNTMNWIEDNIVQTYVLHGLMEVVTHFPKVIPHFNEICRKLGFVKKQRIAKSYKILTIPHGIPRHYEAEVSIPAKYWKDALKIFKQLEKNHYIDFIVEFRFVKADDIWLSPAYGRDSCLITYMAYRCPHEAFFKDVEKAMLDLQSKNPDCTVRPHWGKTFYLKPEVLEKNIPKMKDFKRLRQHLDPNSILVNDFLQRNLQI